MRREIVRQRHTCRDIYEHARIFFYCLLHLLFCSFFFLFFSPFCPAASLKTREVGLLWAAVRAPSGIQVLLRAALSYSCVRP
jgi:hypothetical protein